MSRWRSDWLKGAAFGLGALTLGGMLGLGALLSRPLPSGLLDAPAGTSLVDRRGDAVGQQVAPELSDWAAFADYSPLLVDATLAAEDHRFWRHPGVDPVAIVRAARNNVRARGVVEGGSTITQQLAKELLRDSERTLSRKLTEADLALRLELALSKEDILAHYLGRVRYGHNARGAMRAAEVYFDKPATNLSLQEAALLAALPRRPSTLDPWRHPAAARMARKRVLDRMAARGFVTSEEAALAAAAPLGLTELPEERLAPHYTRTMLSRGLSGDAPELTIPGTLDLALQRKVEAIVAEQLAALAEEDVEHAAVVVVEIATREVLAWVGSGDFGADDGQVDGARAPRSPGSALKPFLYELALERGLTLADPLPDLPAAYTTTHGSYRPGNYDNTWAGPVRSREALARSLNAPAIYLAQQVSSASLRGRLEALGLSTLDKRSAHYGLGLALGDGEVRLDELVGAYAALADGGLYRPLRLRADAPAAPGEQVMDPRAAWLTLDALSDDQARAAAFGRHSVLDTAFPTAVKTGTSTGWRDNWTVGVSPEIAVGVWVGNFDGSEMADVSGISGAGPIWRQVMEAAHEGRPRSDFDRPDGVVSAAICPLSGMAAGPDCDGSHKEWFLEERAPEASCDWHRPDGLSAPSPYGDWAVRSGLPLSREHSAGGLAVRSPADGTSWYLDSRQSPADQAIPLRASAGRGGEARWFVDGVEIARGEAGAPQRWVPTPGEHRIEVAIDGERSRPARVWVGTSEPG